MCLPCHKVVQVAYLAGAAASIALADGVAVQLGITVGLTARAVAAARKQHT
jgi:hypothetical protein